MTPETYATEFAPRLPGSHLPWLADLRADAAARFAVAGLPDRKVEAWRYTDLKAIRGQLFSPRNGQMGAVPPALLPDVHRLVFNNGALVEAAADLPPGVRLLGIAEAMDQAPELLADHLGRTAAVKGLPLPALNQAMSEDGYLLVLEPGVTLAQPIEVLFLNQQGTSHPRNLILAQAGSRATVIEHYLGQGEEAYFLNAVTEIQLQAGAEIRRYKIQREALAASHIATVGAQLAETAKFENFDLNLGARLARSEIHVALQGRSAAADLNGIYLLRGKQHCDNAIHIDHVVGATDSQQDYRGILDDRSHGVFQGKITVRPNAQGIEGHQLNKTLLLSDKAEIDSKPELEILADDVKCSHGATAGELDETGMFYLRSRGIPEWEARQLLMTAFVAQTLEKAGDAPVRAVMEQLVADWMGS
ncbi:MAG: Fe-S cluster assembly protein SufD [Alphaproteobacteria bacterium]